MKTRITLLLLLTFSLSAMAQQTFEGIIKYDIKHNSTTNSNIPTEISITHKGERIKLTALSNKFNVVILSDNSNISTLILELKGDFIANLAMEISNSDLKEKFNYDNNFIVKHTKEKKDIARQSCHKVISENPNHKTYAFIADNVYTNSYGWLFNNQIENLVMELHLNNSTNISLLMKSMMSSQIDDSEFKVPNDCMLISLEDAKAILGEDFIF